MRPCHPFSVAGRGGESLFSGFVTRARASSSRPEKFSVAFFGGLQWDSNSDQFSDIISGRLITASVNDGLSLPIKKERVVARAFVRRFRRRALRNRIAR